MFVRFRQTKRKLQVSLIQTRRADGRVRYEHIAQLGSIEMLQSVPGRIAFWKRLHERLARMADRVDPKARAKIFSDIHARIPMVTLDEQPQLKIETAEAQDRVQDDVVRKVAQLAKIPEARHDYFCEAIRLAIEEAHRVPRISKLQLFRSKQLVPVLNGVARDARKLRDTLMQMNAVGATRTPHDIVGGFLRAELKKEHGLELGTCIDLLEKLASAAAEGAQAFASQPEAADGRPPSNFAVDLFVHRLISAARRYRRAPTRNSVERVNLTIYKSYYSSDGWDGTLWEAMRLLRPILPKGFRSVGGSSLDRIAQRFRPKTRKGRGHRP
jgi:hypothetical protein